MLFGYRRRPSNKYLWGDVLKYSKIEILHALHIIKTVCQEQGYDNCNNCPLCFNGYCHIQHEVPEQWNIKEQKYEGFKAFE